MLECPWIGGIEKEKSKRTTPHSDGTRNNRNTRSDLQKSERKRVWIQHMDLKNDCTIYLWKIPEKTFVGVYFETVATTWDEENCPSNAPCERRPKKKEEFKKKLSDILSHVTSDETLLFQDESTFYQSGLPRKVWAKKGTKPILPIYGTNASLNVFGVINLLKGDSHFQFIKRLNSDCFIQFLKALIKLYGSSKRILLFTDNASAHKSKKVSDFLSSLKGKLELVYLPPYSPDLNPIERVWREVKKEVVYNTFYRYFDDFKGALTKSLRNFRGNRVLSICGMMNNRIGGMCTN